MNWIGKNLRFGRKNKTIQSHDIDNTEKNTVFAFLFFYIKRLKIYQ
jgi:hypothetical protein